MSSTARRLQRRFAVDLPSWNHTDNLRRDPQRRFSVYRPAYPTTTCDKSINWSQLTLW